MRRSQAPSLRYTEKSKLQKENDSAPTTARRTTDAVLSLLLGSSAEGDNYVVENSNERLTESTSHQAHGESNKVESVAHQSCQRSKVFVVVYGKQSKRKHKTWEGDGILEVGEKFLTLKDDDGKVLGTGTVSKSKPIEEGSILLIGSKEVEVIESLESKLQVIKEKSNPIQQVTKKRKLSVPGKKFVIPTWDNTRRRLVLPEPNAEHQWHFNQDGLQITEVSVEGNLSRHLRQHQISGITFLYECVMGFKSLDISGAILADEMGLGKTLQTIVLIWTLLKQGPYDNKPVVKKVLIVTPSSLTMNWYNEFIKWLGREKLVPYVTDSKNKPQNFKGPVMIISYEMFVRYYEDVKDIHFDLLVCDEGHRLKNGNIRTAQLLRSLNSPKRILLSGTPIQNDLKEFYTLVDFVNPNILGTPADFRRDYEEPILSSRESSASGKAVSLGKECAASLNRKTSLFLLRRTKEVLNDYLPSKNEIVVFCRISDQQREIYNYLINSLVDNYEKLYGLSYGFLHLGVIANLKKVCNHPALLWERSDLDEEKEDILLSKINTSFQNIKGNFQEEISSKLTVLINFLGEMKVNFPKERVVVVSNSTQTLDLIEKRISLRGYTFCRLDGSTPASQRGSIVEKFNRQYTPVFVFLLSSKAGGVGLNLTGASRLILYDSDWNPATDLQAMSRIWRDGQKTSVYIYRLLTAGTIEEKIYQRQINKQGLSDGIVDPQKSTSTKLSREEVKDIFAYCDSESDCLTHDMLFCRCNKDGEIASTEVGAEVDERSCQLVKLGKSALKMNELFQWEHHGTPVKSSLLSELCLLTSENVTDFPVNSLFLRWSDAEGAAETLLKQFKYCTTKLLYGGFVYSRVPLMGRKGRRGETVSTELNDKFVDDC